MVHSCVQKIRIMKRYGGRDDSVVRTKTTSSRASLPASNEASYSHTNAEEPTCEGKDVKLTREERLAMWKAKKQALASSCSKKKATDHPLMNLTSSQLNSGGSYSLSTNSSSILNVPALVPVQTTDSHPGNKRHCALKRVARRDSTLPSNVGESSKPAGSQALPDQSKQKETPCKEFDCDGTECGLRPTVLGLTTDVGGFDQFKEGFAIGTSSRVDDLPRSNIHHLGECLECPEQEPASFQECGSGSEELISSVQVDEPSVEMLKMQLYDQNNRLIKCTNLLKRLLSEQDDLCNKLSEHEFLKERFSKLENTLAEVSLLYQVSQISAGAPGQCDQTAEVRCKILEEAVTERDREISKLRGRSTSMEKEFKEERERLVAKLIVAEEGKRVSEAALKENDAMWEQLFNTKITELQSQCADALQLHSSRIRPADDESGEAQGLENDECVPVGELAMSTADGQLEALDST
jgi:hypothetical protein